MKPGFSSLFSIFWIFLAKSITFKSSSNFSRNSRIASKSSLRKSISQLLDIDRLLASTDKFLKTERDNQYVSNIWNIYVKNDEAMFKQDVEDFLYRKNKKLLQIYYADAEKIFNFKESHKLKDKLLQFQESIQEEYDLQIQQAETTVEKEELKQQQLMDNIEIIH